MWISSLNEQGELILKFSENMIDETRGFNISRIDPFALEIYVIPALTTLDPLDQPGSQFNISFLNMTYNPVHFVKDEILI